MIIGKFILFAMKFTGHGGSALPGLVIEKTNPKFLKRSLEKIPGGVIVVSGTNGKTTTTKTISALLEGQGYRVLTNKSGSNFVRGIISTIAKKSKLSGKLPYDIAVFEQDEAHAVQFARIVQPNGVVVLNVLRDQLDRFGEIDNTAKYLHKLVLSAKDFVVLNGNDERVGVLKPSDGVVSFFFGHSKNLAENFLSDDEFHNQKRTKYFSAATPFCELTGFGESSANFNIDGEPASFKTSLGGSHNSINLAAAITTVYAATKNINKPMLASSIEALKPAFGRGETFRLRTEAQIKLQLVKNPASFMHNLRDQKFGADLQVGIVINDDYPDGRDVSWLYDVDFSVLKNAGNDVMCAGDRAYDMAVRLKYDDVAVGGIETKLDKFTDDFINRCGKSAGTIFCTYTAMLKIRSLFKKKYKAVGRIEI